MRDLTALLRPSALEGFAGQAHLVGPKGPIKRLIENNTLFHAFFFGPPGTGKTTLSRIIANLSGRPFFDLNATSLKVEELRKIFDANRGGLMPPVVFIDEVHRLSKNQQEVLLPVMERSEAMIIGASTENPFFALTGAIRSRSLLFEFFPLKRADLEALLDRAEKSENRPLSGEIRNYLIASSAGDARAMLKLLEFALSIAGEEPITVELLKSIRPQALSDGASEDETHYNLASALIKSIRGSDPDAALYYLARLIKGGEEPRFLARRLLILASEDIGNANPNALILANAAFQSVAAIGWPESRIILAQLAIYLACSPKSNTAIKAIDEAMGAVEGGLVLEVPAHLKDAHFAGAKKLGRGVEYKYPHDFGGYVKQTYTAQPVHFVDLLPVGYEKTLADWLEKIKALDP
ncbi:MAG: replication-associated recombination protein A [Campylobacterales bacterium]